MTANATPSASPAREAPRRLTAAEAAADYVSRHRWWIMLGLITAAIMEVLDTTIINVALPQMAGNLGATQQEISWVSTGLHPVQCRRAADDGVLHRANRAAALPHDLDRHLHRRLVLLRHLQLARPSW